MNRAGDDTLLTASYDDIRKGNATLLSVTFYCSCSLEQQRICVLLLIRKTL